MKRISIGRADDNDYIVNHPEVSAYHADLYINDNQQIVYIDHSTNGTIINGMMVHNMQVQLSGSESILLPGNICIYCQQIFYYIQNKNQEKEHNQPRNNSGGRKNNPSPRPSNSNVNYNFRKKKPSMGFGETFIYFFKNYVNFSGRARRSEFWYMYLWNLIIGSLLFFLCLNDLLIYFAYDELSYLPNWGGFGFFLSIIWSLGTFIPFLALFVRRLHDINKSGLNLLFILIPFVGAIILFVFSLLDSDRNDNEYGPSVKY